jgi:hypothetical protein
MEYRVVHAPTEMLHELVAGQLSNGGAGERHYFAVYSCSCSAGNSALL